MRILRCILMIFFVLFVVSNGNALIISTSGNAQTDTIPSDFTQDAYENNDFVTGFDEQQDVFTTSSINVDLLVDSSDYGIQFNGDEDTNNMLPIGVYDSHFLHIDPVGTAPVDPFNTVYNAVFDFDDNIVALIFSDVSLSNTENIFGISSTSYENPDLHWRDLFTITDSNTLTIDYFRTEVMDNMRVITGSPVPEPTTWLLFGTGILGLLGYGRKKFFKRL